MSHGLDVAVWGLNPLGHHLTNSPLHAANSFLVVLLMMKLLELAGQRNAAGSFPVFLSDRGILLAAGSAGLLFAIHPIHVESVAWVSERKDLLCGLFFFLGILLYLQSQEEERIAQRRPSLLNWRSAAVLGCFNGAQATPGWECTGKPPRTLPSPFH